MASARLNVNAATARLAMTSDALNELEAKVDSMGVSPRYGVAWEQSLRNARKADEDAHAAFVEAQSELDRIIAALDRLKRQD